MVTPTLLNDVELTTLITSVCTSARDTQTNLQAAIIQTVMHGSTVHGGSGNLGPLARIVNELPNSSRVNVIMAYVKAHAPIRFVVEKDVNGNKIVQKDGRTQYKCKLEKAWVASDWKIEDMMAVPYYNWKKPDTDKEVEFDLVDSLKNLLKRIDKALKTGGNPVMMDKYKVARATMLARNPELVV